MADFWELLINTTCIIMCTIIFWTLKSLFHKRKLLKFSRNLRGHRFYPLLGNGLHLMHAKDLLSGITSITAKFGTPCNMWIGHEYHYVTDDASEIKIILNHPNAMEKGAVYEHFKILFANTLLLMPVVQWKKARKFCAKSFNQRILNTFVEVFYEKSISLNVLLKNAKEFNKFDLLQRYTYDSVLATVVGMDLKIQERTQVKLVELIIELQDLASDIILSASYMPPLLWQYTKRGRRSFKIVDDVKKSIKEIMEAKKKSYENQAKEKNEIVPLLDAMLESNDFSDDDIFSESTLFITAAVDTSASSLVFFFTLLGMHPDIQEKCYVEIIDVVGLDRPIVHSDLVNLKYTERAIFEAMRIFPVTPFVSRRVSDDLDLGTKVLPKDSNIVISTFDLHRNDKYYDNPREFNPDRFLPDEVKKRENMGYTFLPFSGGPRNCIGRTYAIMLMKTATANVIRNYEIISNYKSIEEIKLVSLITMKTEDETIDLEFVPRSQHLMYK